MSHGVYELFLYLGVGLLILKYHRSSQPSINKKSQVLHHRLYESEKQLILLNSHRDTFSVFLTKLESDHRIKTMKIVRSYSQDSLLQVKNGVDNLPYVIAIAVSKEEALEIQRAFLRIGATVEIL